MITGQHLEPATRQAVARRDFLVRTLGAGVSLGALPALLAACGSSPAGSSSAKRGGTLRYGAQYDLLKLDPAFADSEVAADYAIYEGLIAYESSAFTVANRLAEEFEQSKDGRQFRFKLRDGVPFHDGFGEVTADDVKFSFERIAGMTKPKVDAYTVADWAPHLDEVKVHGKLEGTVVLNRPFAPLTTTTLPLVSGLVVSKRAVEERGERFARKPVGTGPYRVASFTPKRELVLERFEEYGGTAAKPFFDQIVITRNGEVNSVAVALSTEDLDACEFPSTELKRFESIEDVTTKQTAGVRYDWISMNVTDPVLSDLRVRKAIRLAVDVPSIVTAAYNGVPKQANAVIPPSMPIGYWEKAPRYARDVEQAKALLREAGVGKVSLALRANNEEPQYVRAAQIVKENLAEVGIDVELNLQDSATFFASAGESLKQDQLTIVGFSSSPDPFWSMQWFTCDQVGVYNMMSWCNKEFDSLLTKSTRELDPKRRSDIYIRMQELWDEAANAVWLTWPTATYATRPGVKGVWLPDGEPLFQAFAGA